MEVQVDGRRLNRLRFAEDMVLTSSTISKVERMLADFNDSCGKIDVPRSRSTERRYPNAPAHDERLRFRAGIYVDPHTDFAEWLGPEFYEQFKERTACLITMYKESKIDGFKVNGHSTLEENIADNEGAKLAFKVHQRLTNEYGTEGRLEEMQDFDNDQMFFLSYAMFFCNKYMYNKEFLLWTILMDPHSPDILRVNNVLANMPEFAKAFHCSPDSPMNPKTRCPLYSI